MLYGIPYVDLLQLVGKMNLYLRLKKHQAKTA